MLFLLGNIFIERNKKADRTNCQRLCDSSKAIYSIKSYFRNILKGLYLLRRSDVSRRLNRESTLKRGPLFCNSYVVPAVLI